MDPKFFIIFFAMITYSHSANMLRKRPKVYNALITTDDNLQSSRAFPVIQPTIHETGIATYPFGPFNPYGFYNPPLLHTAQRYPNALNFPPIAPQGQPPLPPQQPINPQEQPTGPSEQSQFLGPFMSQSGEPVEYPPQYQPQRPPNYQSGPPHYPSGPSHYPLGQFPFQQVPFHQPPFQQAPLPPQGPPPNPEQMQPLDLMQPNRPSELPISHSNSDPKQEQLPVLPAGDRPATSQQPNQQQAPQLPLNEFGLPPSLIPVNTYGQQAHHQFNLQPYPYNNYPLIYDQFNQFAPSQQHHQGHYLPHFGRYPQHNFGIYNSQKPTLINPENPTSPIPLPSPTTPKITANEQISERSKESISSVAPLLDYVKNGVENKNNDVPDVPPPPSPTSTKNSS